MEVNLLEIKIEKVLCEEDLLLSKCVMKCKGGNFKIIIIVEICLF